MGKAKAIKTVRIAALFGLALAAYLGLLGSGESQATAGVSGSASSRYVGKIERRVLDDTANSKSTQFIVLMAEQADVSKAYAMRDQDARGWFVYNSLRATADRSQSAIKAALDARSIGYKSYWAANMLVVSGNRSLVDTLAARSDVRAIESNRAFKGIDDVRWTMDDSAGGSSSIVYRPSSVEWGVQNVNAPQVWAMGFTGQGIVIANQDTGMRWTHNAIKPHYRGWDGTTADHNYNWWDAIHSGGGSCGADNQAPCDDHGHGTHTTGTTVGDDGAGNQVGVAPGAKWIGCRNMDQGNGTPATYTECFQFFIAPTDLSGNNPNPALRPHVMNDSWGCPTSEGCAATTLQTIVENTQASGIFVEASAGNSGPGCASVTDPPSLYAAAFSTGAIDSADTLASFSSRGPVTVDGSNRRKPDISAPGVNVRSSYVSSDISYANLSGTSMAGPHVVGVVALLWSAHPELSRMITETKNLLENTANPGVIVSPAQSCGGTPSSQIPNSSFGYGRVDALAAVNGAGPTGTPIATVTGTPTRTRTSTRTPTVTFTPIAATSTPAATRTNTPTNTPTDVAVELSGHIGLQGRPVPPDPRWSVPVTFTLRLTEGGPDYNYSTTTDASGYFTVTAPGPGVYNYRVKNPQTLANAGSDTLASGTNNVEVGTLLAGDANNDNCVNVQDFSVLKNTFGKSVGDPGYDARADFNGDNVISVTDFGLQKNNFGICGAGPIR